MQTIVQSFNLHDSLHPTCYPCPLCVCVSVWEHECYMSGHVCCMRAGSLGHGKCLVWMHNWTLVMMLGYIFFFSSDTEQFQGNMIHLLTFWAFVRSLLKKKVPSRTLQQLLFFSAEGCRVPVHENERATRGRVFKNGGMWAECNCGL